MTHTISQFFTYFNITFTFLIQFLKFKLLKIKLINPSTLSLMGITNLRVGTVIVRDKQISMIAVF